MSNVDKRVVEMQFDNKQFEKDMATTVKSLKNFEKSLEFKDGNKGLEGFEKRLKNVEKQANNIDFNKLYNSVEQIKNKFSLLGMVAFSTVQKLTQDTINKVTSGLNQIYDTIMVKGEQRALNLEQANFKLMGLLKNEKEVAKVMEDVDYAVSGTAYGLDTAASVAAQLAASNIKAGDEMKTALRGISGVASMTSSSYEEIGQVFTRVAGQGKVMATDLNSLAARGLNAAAELGKFLGVTESEVRQMVSKGVIDFKTFATAMNEAFGEQSKKANETFTGAMKNVQAALARVGAGFKQPYIKYMRPVLVQLIDNINAVKDAFGPLYDTTSFLFEKISHFIITVLEPLVNVRKEGEKQIKTIGFLRDIFKNLQELVVNNWERIARLINTVTHLFWKFIDTLKPIASILTFLLKDLFGELMGLSWSLKDTYKKGNFLYRVLDSIKDILVIVYRWFVTSWPNVKKILSSVFTIIKSIFNLAVKIIRPIKDALFEIVSFDKVTEVLADLIDAISGVFKAVTEAFNESTESGEVLHEVFSFVFSILKVGITIIGKVVSFLAKGIRFLTPYIKILTSIAIKIGDILFQLLKLGFGKAAEGVQFLIDKFKSMEGPLRTVREWFVNAKTWLVDKFTSYTTAASDGLNWLKEQLTGSKKEFDSTGDSAENSGNKISEFKEKVKETTSSMVESIKSNQVVQTVWEKIKTFFSYIWTGIKNLVNQVKTNFSKAFEGVTQRGVTPTVFDWLRGAFKSIGQLASDLIENLGPVKDALLKLTGTDSLMDLIQRIVSVFLSFQMGKFFKSFANFHDALANLPKSISDFVNAIRKPFDEINKNFKKRPSSALKNFAASMLMLAASLFIISKIPYKRLDNSLKTLVALVTIMVGAVIGVNLALKNVANAYKSIMAFALVIFAFQKVIRNIMLSFTVLMLVVDKVKPATVWRSLAVVSAITVLIGAFTILFAKFAKMEVSATQLLAFSLLIKSFGSVIKGIALMIAILSLPIFNPGKIAVASGCIAGIAIIIGALLTLFISKGSRYGNTPRQIMAFSLLIKSFGSVINEMALMIAILSLPIFNPGRLWNSIAIVSVIGVLIGGLLATMKLVQNNRASQIVSFALFVKAIGSTLKGIMILIGILSLLNPGRVWGCVGVIAAISAIIAGLANLSSKIGGNSLYKVGKGIMFIGVGILALATAIKTFSKLTPEAIIRVSDVITALVTKAPKWLGIIVTGLIEVINSLAPTIAESFINLFVTVIEIMTKSASTIVTALMNFFKVLVKEISSFSNAFDIKDLFWAINAVALIAGLIYVLQVIASDMKSALKGIALMGIILGAIVGALIIINNFTDPEKSINLLKGIAEVVIALAGVFAIIASISALTQKLTVGSGKQAASLFIALGAFLALIILLPLTMQLIGFIFSGWAKDGYKELTVAIEVMKLVGQAFGNLFGEFTRTFSDIVNQAQNAENITKILVPVLLSITPLLIGLAALFPFLIPLFAAIAAGAAAIMYFDIDTDKLKESFETLKELAKLIGGLLGVFIGEIFAEASSGLATAMETFASGLSAFMEKLQPFLGYLKDISFDTLKKATMLTGIIIELAAGEVMAAAGTFVDKLAGGATLVSMAKIYSDFMDILFNGFDGGDGFFKLVGQLSQKQLTNSLILAKIIKSMANAQIISAVSNWFRIFGGGNPLKDLAEQLSKAAPDMVLFSNILSDGKFNGDLTLKASECILMMARVANLMREGGLLQEIIGNPKNLADFAGELTTLGGKLVEFSGSINELTTRDLNNIKITIPIIESLIKIADSMPRENGVFQWAIGNLRDLGTFGDDLKNFGSGMLGFAVSLEGMTQEHADRFKLVEPIITSLVKIANALPKENGIWQRVSGQTKSMTDFAADLLWFAKGFGAVSYILDQIPEEELTTLNKITPIITSLANVANTLKTTNIDVKTLVGSLSFSQSYDLKNFGDSLEALGNGLTKYAASTNKISVGNATNAQNAATILEKLVPVLDLLKTNETTILWYTSKQKFDFEDLGDSLGKLGTGLSTFAENTSKIGNIKNAGSISGVLKGYVDAIVATKDVDTNGVVNFVDSLNKINESSSKLTAATGIFGDNNYNAQKAYERVQAIAASITLLSNAFGNSNVQVPESFFTALYDLAYGIENSGNAHEISDLLKVSYALGESNQNAQWAYLRILTLKSAIDVLSTAFNNAGQGEYSSFKDKFLPALRDLAQSNLSGIVNVFGENANLEEIKTKAATISGILEDFVTAFQKLDADKVTQVEDFTEAVDNLANTLTQDLATSIALNTPKVITAIDDMIKSINNKIKSKDIGINESTKELMTNLSNGMIANSAIAINGFVSVLTKCIDSAKTYNSIDSNGNIYTFYSIGSSAVDGLVKGIEDNLYKAVDAGRKIGKSALQGTQFSLDVHSPSKEYGKLAYFGILGLVNEFAACSDMVFRSGQDIGNSAMNGTKSIIANLDSAINSDMNLQPVISPVLDLSEVSSQAGLIGGMLNAGTSYRIAGATSSLINQNNTNRARAKINQNRSPDVVEAVNALNSRMDSLEQAIINRPIVMDGEKVTKQIAPSMDRALGRRKYYSGRGN